MSLTTTRFIQAELREEEQEQEPGLLDELVVYERRVDEAEGVMAGPARRGAGSATKRSPPKYFLLQILNRRGDPVRCNCTSRGQLHCARRGV